MLKIIFDRARFLAICAAVLFSTAMAARGNVVVDSVNAGGGTNSNGGFYSISWLHTVGNVDNRLLVVGISTYSDSAFPGSPVADVKIGNQYFEFVGARYSPCPNCNAHTAIYRLGSPPQGNNIIVVSFRSGEYPTRAVGGSVSFAGVDQTQPTGTYFSSAGTIGSLPRLTVTDSATGDLVVDVLAIAPNAGHGSAGSNQTMLWAGRPFFANQFDIGASSMETANSPVEMNWNLSVQSHWALGAVAVKSIRPSASSVSVSGIVRTFSGMGIPRARLSLTDSYGNVRTALTNPFGYYRFDEVDVGQTIVLTVSSKTAFFAEPTRAIAVDDELTEIDFVALEQPY